MCYITTYTLHRRAQCTSYRPELDVSPVLGPHDASYYIPLIGILRWIVELGCVEIFIEVSIISSHMSMPREGHLEQLFHIFYHQKYHNYEMVFDPSYPVIGESKFQRKEWASIEFLHLEGKEETCHYVRTKTICILDTCFVRQQTYKYLVRVY